MEKKPPPPPPRFALYLYDGTGTGARACVVEAVMLDPAAVVAMNQALVRTLYRWIALKPDGQK